MLRNFDPLVSIVVPAYNAERFIGQTLDSLNKQLLQDIEIIVVNDGSTDGTEKMVRQFFFDRRLRYFKKENGGTGSALNYGHEKAEGKYITWCSADNIYFPNFTLELAQALIQCEQQRLPISFVYSDFCYINENSQKLKDVVHERPQPRNDLANGYDLGMSFMYTKELWNKVGLYWGRICEDYNWAVRAAQYTEFGLIRNILAAFRVHNNQITGSNKEEEFASSQACRDLAKQFIKEGLYSPIKQSKPEFNPILVEE